jgi:hypothetical protein
MTDVLDVTLRARAYYGTGTKCIGVAERKTEGDETPTTWTGTYSIDKGGGSCSHLTIPFYSKSTIDHATSLIRTIKRCFFGEKHGRLQDWRRVSGASDTSLGSTSAKMHNI